MDDNTTLIIGIALFVLLILGVISLGIYFELNELPYDKCLDECYGDTDDLELMCIQECNYAFQNQTMKPELNNLGENK